MRALVAAVVLVGLSVLIAEADEKPIPPWTPSTLTPEKDWRLAKQPGTRLQTIGLLSYYPNNGGGYTFIERKEIAFYALPYWRSISFPLTVGAYRNELVAMVMSERLGAEWASGRLEWRVLSIIGTSKMPWGALTVYHGDMRKTTSPDALLREDTPIAQWSSEADFPFDKWSRDTANGKFRLLIMAEDRETRLKLKSIIPVLEHAEHAP
jgi:hypothetical protein